MKDLCNSRWIRWATVLGFALGGFFDGILLHQILQWHHLLSLMPDVSSLRFQVLWDGYFHALMYAIAALGLWGLWRARNEGTGPWGLQTLGAILLGFGVWQFVDSVLSHWILGIHRVKLDSPSPLMWDLIWFFAFALVPMLLGALLLRRKRGLSPVNPATLTVLARAGQHGGGSVGISAAVGSAGVHNGGFPARDRTRNGGQSDGGDGCPAGLVGRGNVGRGLQTRSLPKVVPVSTRGGAGQRLGPACRMLRLEPGVTYLSNPDGSGFDTPAKHRTFRCRTPSPMQRLKRA